MKRAYEVIVKGDVQKSAFRRFVKQLAKRHNLFGSVENLDNYDEDVRIICEGEEENLQAFLGRLKNQTAEDKEETTAMISNIEIKEIPSGGKFDNFRIRRGPEEVAERLDEGLVIMNKGFKSLENKIERGFNKSDENSKLLGDKTENGFKSLAGETRDGFSKMDENFKSLDGKYGSITGILTKINGNLEKIVGKA